MITVLGLIIFFGLTSLILWQFNESLWRVDGDEVSDTQLVGHNAPRENTAFDGEKIESNSAPKTAQYLRKY